MTLIVDLASDDMPFINAKIGGVLIDFENSVDFDDSILDNRRQVVKGRVGDQSPAASHDISMLWETGKAEFMDQEVLHCSYDNQTCYKAKTVPVIFGTSSNSGFKTGGQLLTVKGYGFDSGVINATVDGVTCEVTSSSKTEF